MSGINAFGTQLKRGDGAGPEVFTSIADATGISGPGLSRETLDVTSHGSPDVSQPSGTARSSARMSRSTRSSHATNIARSCVPDSRSAPSNPRSACRS